jgi:SAM-dependent methyltransferase
LSTLKRFRSQLGLLFASRATRRHALVGNPRLWRMKRAFQIEFLRRMGLEREHQLLDLGCGTLRGGLPLIEYLAPGHYTGVDVRADVLEEARAELREAGLERQEPRLVHASDLGALELDDGPVFDWIWAFSVLIHLDDEALAAALRFAARHLAPGGSFCANVRTEGADEGERWQGFPVVTRPLDFYRAAAARAGLSVRDLGSLAALGHTSGEPAQDRQHMLLLRGSSA